MIMQLTEAQRTVLQPACERDDLCVFPIVAKLTGGAVGNVCKSLVKRGLLQETPATGATTVWRHGEDGTPLTLQATDAGRRAVNGEPVIAAAHVPGVPVRDLPPPAAQAKESRQDALLRLLRRSEGATIADLAEATGWQSHSIRGALSGVIGKRLGLKVTSEKLPERGRVYRVS